MRRAGLAALIGVGLLVTGLVLWRGRGGVPMAVPTPVRWSDVVQARLVAIPEGPQTAPFVQCAAGDQGRCLSQLDRWAPPLLPDPMDQRGCDTGGDMVLTLSSGQQITYGPCRRPPEIERLWAGIIFVESDGRCAPICGPGGKPGP